MCFLLVSFIAFLSFLSLRPSVLPNQSKKCFFSLLLVLLPLNSISAIFTFSPLSISIPKITELLLVVSALFITSTLAFRKPSSTKKLLAVFSVFTIRFSVTIIPLLKSNSSLRSSCFLLLSPLI